MGEEQDNKIDSGFASFISMLMWTAGFTMGLLCGNYSGEHRIKKTHIPRNEASAMMSIDRDPLLDLVKPNGTILLADRTEQGIAYRPLTSSDRYRIQY